jgi:hypothetical protein
VCAPFLFVKIIILHFCKMHVLGNAEPTENVALRNQFHGW